MNFCSLLLPFAKLVQRDRLLQDEEVQLLPLLSLLIFDEFCLFFQFYAKMNGLSMNFDEFQTFEPEVFARSP